jgi:MoaA/NifB/PqqE/SkfB family radical SAM enzyme
MYCPAEWHNNTDQHHSLETLKSAWISIYERSWHLGLLYKISFTGGEVTNNKNFLPFVEWLRTEYSNSIFQLLVTTNGSATSKYYIKLFKVIDNISFSVHSEHIDECKFFETVIHLRKSIDNSKFLHVNIMNEFWNQDRILVYKKLLETHNISYNINEIDYNLKTREIPIFKGKLNLEI